MGKVKCHYCDTLYGKADVGAAWWEEHMAGIAHECRSCYEGRRAWKCATCTHAGAAVLVKLEYGNVTDEDHGRARCHLSPPPQPLVDELDWCSHWQAKS